MHYQQFLPSQRLEGYIKYFWVLESEENELDHRSFQIIPDGSPGLIFQDNGAFTDHIGNPLPQLFIYGQTTMHAQQKVKGNFKTIGVYFHPHGIQSLFGIDAQHVTNQNIAVSDFLNELYLSEQLSYAESDREKIQLISNFLLTCLMKNRNNTNNLASLAALHIIAKKGTSSLSDLHHHYSVSKRTLERRFLQSIGVSAKFFARLTRFQSALDSIRQGNFNKLSDVAYAHDYADQCHFIRDFKEFSGSTPKHFISQYKETVSNFPELLP
ncbi:MAG: DUF6597 domain-containing transcriptional factor [Bacteroidota bacterium]